MATWLEAVIFSTCLSVLVVSDYRKPQYGFFLLNKRVFVSLYLDAKAEAAIA